jgi:hypothetical protein
MFIIVTEMNIIIIELTIVVIRVNHLNDDDLVVDSNLYFK